MAAIDIQNLSKTYYVGFLRKKEKYALKPFSLKVEQNEIFGFLGPNGAGKTTTLKLLMGLIFPTGGSARILDMDWRDPRVKEQIGFLPEQPYFYDYLTGPELLEYFAELSGVHASERKRRVQSVLARVGLPEVGSLQLRKFSKGMLQRVGIAQAIVHDPKVLFLDEPMSGLDPMGRREVRDLIQSLKDEGKTIFFSTHILSDAEALCSRVAVIHKGELRAVGVVADLLKTKEGTGESEIVWHGAQAVPAIVELGGKCHETGNILRAVVSASKLEATLDSIRKVRGNIVSIIPVRGTLEDYFLEQLQDRPATPNTSEQAVEIKR